MQVGFAPQNGSSCEGTPPHQEEYFAIAHKQTLAQSAMLADFTNTYQDLTGGFCNARPRFLLWFTPLRKDDLLTVTHIAHTSNAQRTHTFVRTHTSYAHTHMRTHTCTHVSALIRNQHTHMFTHTQKSNICTKRGFD